MRPSPALAPTRRRLAALAGTAVTVAALFGGMAAAGGPAAAAQPAHAKAGAAAPTFRAASFNLLGANHTVNKKAWQPGEIRMKRALRVFDRRELDVVGLQELQWPQYQVFVERGGETWDAFPGNDLSRRVNAIDNSIAWRLSTWEPVEENTIEIPYFDGRLVPMPYVLLRHVPTGQLVWFANFHNPTDGAGHGDQAVWRKQARKLEIRLANTLWATGHPLVLTGDMNEDSTYFCKMVRKAPMISASGGSVRNGTCQAPKKFAIDWIFGSKDLRFTNYTRWESKVVKALSDHPLYYADVTVGAR